MIASEPNIAVSVPYEIQPHGVLLVVDTQAPWLIRQVSQNIAEYFGTQPEGWVGKRLFDCLPGLSAQCPKGIFDLSTRNFFKPVELIIHGTKCILQFHKDEAQGFVEIFPGRGGNKEKSFYQLVQKFATEIAGSWDLDQAASLMASSIRAIIGVGRVLIYHFDEHCNGIVLAESKQEGYESLQSYWFHAGTLSSQTRALFSVSPFRIIPNIHYQGVGLWPETPKIDLTLCSLGTLSLQHKELILGMGVQGSAVFPLFANEMLLGLVVCQDNLPKSWEPEEIETVLFLVKLFSAQLSVIEVQNQKEWWKKYGKFLQKMEGVLLSGSQRGFRELGMELESWFGASLVVVKMNSQWYYSRPPWNASFIESTIRHFENKIQADVWITPCLASELPESIPFKEKAAGLFALRLSRGRNHSVLVFRGESSSKKMWLGSAAHPLHLGHTLPQQNLLPSVLWTLQDHDAVRALLQKVSEVDKTRVGRQLSETNMSLMEANESLRLANAELDAFSYMVSHDLREPLRGIKFYIKKLAKDAESFSDSNNQVLKNLDKLSSHAEDLIDSLLRYSRFGKVSVNLANVPLEEIIHAALDLIDPSLKSANTQLKVHENFPSVPGDQVLLEEVFINLISNALKYNNKPLRKVEVGHIGQTIFFVSDNGVGIPQDCHLEVFQLFRRFHSKTQFNSGSGCGLAIVKKLIEKHEGTIWFESKENLGTTFYFTLQHSLEKVRL